MGSKNRSFFRQLFAIESHERKKVLLLTLTFFLVVSAYTLAKELGASIFMAVVGKEYMPWAKVLTLILFVPAIFLYSKLVDSIRRYQLLASYAFFFGIAGLIFTYLLGHPQIGINNTDSSPYRIFGWLFYFFVEGYSPFVVSVFWAFANSITTPEGAKNNYAIIVSGSKIGGMLSAGFAWFLFSWKVASRNMVSDVFVHQLVLAGSATMLLLVPVVVFMLIKTVPGRYLHGYEAVYQVEKSKKREGKGENGIFAGLKLLLRYPYVLGIFGMVYFYEVVATVISYLRYSIAQSSGESISGVTGFLFQTMFVTHFVGFLIALFGTRTLLKHFGERICLLLTPLLTGLLLLYLTITTTPYAVMVAFVLLKAINYAFSWPVRESLYIPTVKEIKFKSKSWVDAFGSKFAKASGSSFNIVASRLGPALFLPIHSFFFAGIVSLWFLTAFLLGKRYDWAIEHDEVIGLEGVE